jgi:hypothetical protein
MSAKFIHGFIKEQNDMSDLLSIHQVVIEKAIKLLEASGATYAIQYNGNTYGTLQVKPAPLRQRRYAKGETSAHYLPIIGGLKVGEGASVPMSYFDPRILSSNISGYCVHHWGASNAMTKINRKNQTIEVIRLG